MRVDQGLQHEEPLPGSGHDLAHHRKRTEPETVISRSIVLIADLELRIGLEGAGDHGGTRPLRATQKSRRRRAGCDWRAAAPVAPAQCARQPSPRIELILLDQPPETLLPAPPPVTLDPAPGPKRPREVLDPDLLWRTAGFWQHRVAEAYKERKRERSDEELIPATQPERRTCIGPDDDCTRSKPVRVDGDGVVRPQDDCRGILERELGVAL